MNSLGKYLGGCSNKNHSCVRYLGSGAILSKLGEKLVGEKAGLLFNLYLFPLESVPNEDPHLLI